MALMAAHGEITPMPTAAIFADTGDEPESVYKWLDHLERLLPSPVYRVSRGRISEDSLKIRFSQRSQRTYLKTLIPAFVQQPDGSKGLLGRKCTRDYKVEMILRKVKELALIKRGQKTVGCIQWIGISIDEAHRMKDAHVPWTRNIWPLIDKGVSRSDCLAWMAAQGYPEPPRSACVFCPFHSDAEWRRLKEHEPNEFDKAVKFERDLQHAATQQVALTGKPYLNSRMIPIDEIDFKENRKGYEQLDLFGNECEGLCGV